jgi:H+/Cl- antiporter ClcA
MSDVSNGKEKTAASGPRFGHREDADDRSGFLGLARLSLAAGAVTGLVGAVFRLSLDRVVISATCSSPRRSRGIAGLMLVPAACAIATAVAAWMVRRFSPYASVSGIPHVKAVLSGQLPHAPFSLVPVKFAGGLLARCFEMRTAIAALGASEMAIAVSRLFLGDVPDFTVDPLAFAGPQKTALFLVLGVVAGFVALIYNRLLRHF